MARSRAASPPGGSGAGVGSGRRAQERAEERTEGPRNLLLLTATITPPAGARDLTRRDANIRLADYLRALEGHLSLLETGLMDGMVFAENSGSDLSAIESAAAARGLRDRVELLSFDDRGEPPSYGRAYGEARIFDHAMAHSRRVGALDDRDVIWKVTGRYTVKNFRALVDSRPAHAELYCNMRDYPIRWVDMYLLAWTRTGYAKFLQGIALELRLLPETPLGMSPEQMLREKLEARAGRGGLVPRFGSTPLLDGIRGFDGRSYAEANRWKNLVRRVALKVAPRLWI
jgi:hypothetical protein